MAPEMATTALAFKSKGMGIAPKHCDVTHYQGARPLASILRAVTLPYCHYTEAIDVQHSCEQNNERLISAQKSLAPFSTSVTYA